MKFRLLFGLSCAILFVVLAVAGVQARPFDSAEGPRGHGDPEMSFVPFPLLQMLNLTDSQEREVAMILSKYRAKIGEVVSARKEAAKNLMESSTADAFSESSVRTAAEGLAAQDVEAALLRARIMNEVKSVLSAEQKERLDGFRDRRAHRMKQRMENRISALDDWIEAHLK